MGYGYVAPQLRVFGDERINEGTSIFSAELSALQMACVAIKELTPVGSSSVVISDSKAALLALERGGTKNRGALQQTVLKTCHEIITQGNSLSFLWVPSHCNIKGNDLADRIAKDATHSYAISNIGLSNNEIKSRVFETARTLWQNHLQQYCQNHGHIYLNTNKGNFSSLPRKLQKIIRRINLGRHRLHFVPLACGCGIPASLQHIFVGCDKLPATIEINDLIRAGTFTAEDFRRPHPVHGFELMRKLASAVLLSDTQNWF